VAVARTEAGHAPRWTWSASYTHPRSRAKAARAAHGPAAQKDPGESTNGRGRDARGTRPQSRCEPEHDFEAGGVIDLNNVSTVTKLQAANRQLSTAIRLFFNDGDAVAVHTLACAAREIYEKQCNKAGVDRMLNHLKASNPQYTQKEIMDFLNAARNFFKHGGESLDDAIEFSDEMNDFVLFSACHDCTIICTPNQPAEVQAYWVWFNAVKDGSNTAQSEKQQSLTPFFPI
jgi:hypothetical protein